MTNRPLLVAFNGVPGSGKTTLARVVAVQVAARVFCEPEEPAWPGAATGENRFAALSAFRAMRVRALEEAARCVSQGGVAIVDSYFDKLLALHVEGPASRWLLEPGDPNYQEWRGSAMEDHLFLPAADVVVNLEVSLDDWRRLLRRRGRRDDTAFARMDITAFQGELLAAGRQFAAATGARLFDLRRNTADPTCDAHAIADELLKLAHPPSPVPGEGSGVRA